MFRDYCWDIFGTWIRHLLNYFEVKSLIFGVLKCWLTLFELYLQWAVWGGPHQNNISHVHCPPHSLYSQHTCSRLHWWRKVRQHTCLVDAWGVESFPCIYILEKKKDSVKLLQKIPEQLVQEWDSSLSKSTTNKNIKSFITFNFLNGLF